MGEGDKKRRGRGRRRRIQAKIKLRYGCLTLVWNLDFWYGNYSEYGFCMDHMDFVWDSRKVYEFQI